VGRERVFEVTEDPKRPKFYCLEMLPYPSGDIHVGHVRNYCITDVVARCKTMRGMNVMHPIGWDALGLPAENAGHQEGDPPREVDAANIAGMKRQLQRLGFSYPWSREIATAIPSTTAGTSGSSCACSRRASPTARRRRSTGARPARPCSRTSRPRRHCWRCGSVVEQRDMSSGSSASRVPGRAARRHGAASDLAGARAAAAAQLGGQVARRRGRLPGRGRQPLRIFTTRVDTIYGATFMVLAPEHPRVDALSRARRGRAQARSRAPRPGPARAAEGRSRRKASSPAATRRTRSRRAIPIWVGNFVLMGYGTGAIMSVPAHDERDFEFARKYGLPVRS
jgi:leucyl-tRNA synthetase